MTTQTSFPETRSAWARLIWNLRSIMSLMMFNAAVSIAPASEKLSATLAFYEHMRRVQNAGPDE